MSKTETQSDALTAERRLFITAVANLELRKKFGDEGFRLDLERDELEALIEMAERVSRLDAEVRELKMTVQHESLCVEAAKERIEALDAENKALRADAERYRWLRVQPDDCSAPRIDICHWTCEPGDSVNNGEGLRGDAADQAIDAAMAAAKTGDAA